MSRNASLLKAIIDTNIIVSSFILKRGTPYQLVRAFYAHAFTLVISPSIRAEYEDVLSRPWTTERYGLSPEEVNEFLFYHRPAS